MERKNACTEAEAYYGANHAVPLNRLKEPQRRTPHHYQGIGFHWTYQGVRFLYWTVAMKVKLLQAKTVITNGIIMIT